MKTDKKAQALQRQIIDKKLSKLVKLTEPPPPSGWAKAIRGSLGMTAKQLSQRLGTSAAGVIQLEERESTKKVTLESLEKVANAMGCQLVYAIIPKQPNKSLEKIIEQQSKLTAARILQEVSHTMRLEAQGVSNEDTKKQIERIASELRLKADSRIWDLAPPKKMKK
jgi:predicted DNA-binding mobile mystery protein A